MLIQSRTRLPLPRRPTRLTSRAAYAARDAFLRRVALREKILVPSLLGDLSVIGGESSRAPLGAKVGPVVAGPSYALGDSDIAEAGSSQRGKGWVYA